MSGRQVLVEGLTFPEAPRWHEGRLWFSDFYAHQVYAMAPDGALEAIVEVPHQPSGLGWQPDGRLLIVSVTDQKLLRFDGKSLEPFADLSGLARFWCNDMVVDAKGRAYVGNFGFDNHGGEEPRGTNLIRVDPDGSVHLAAPDVLFPNGTVITPDGRTLILGETYGRRLSAFDVAEDGSLSNRRLFADIGPNVPDGICLDAEGQVWSADPRNREVIRVREGGEVTERISTGDRGAYACMLGGAAGRTLYICTNTISGAAAAERRQGRIEAVEVAVPRAGLP